MDDQSYLVFLGTFCCSLIVITYAISKAKREPKQTITQPKQTTDKKCSKCDYKNIPTICNKCKEET